jgi:hypothetical protein
MKQEPITEEEAREASAGVPDNENPEHIDPLSAAFVTADELAYLTALNAELGVLQEQLMESQMGLRSYSRHLAGKYGFGQDGVVNLDGTIIRA